MFRTILLPSDLFGVAPGFPRCLSGAAAIGVETAHLVQAIPPVAFGRAASLLRGLAQPGLAEQQAQLEALGLRVEIHTPQGEPVSVILDVAERENIGMIAVSSFSAGLFAEALVHPLADALLHQSAFPLLGLGCRGDAQTCRPLDQVFGGRLLFATDFSRCAAHALERVREIVARTGAEVVAMHVQERRRIFPYLADRLEEFDRTDRERLESLGRDLRRAGARTVQQELELGHAGPAICEAARRLAATLVVVGTRGRGWGEELFVGSVAQHVARNAPCPVLLVPGRREPV
ncbi:MAG: universal stress protein [Thermodesulfobacteriota bacterium]